MDEHSFSPRFLMTEWEQVVVMACDDEVVPLQERKESVTEVSELEDAYNTERHVLYVACTRAPSSLVAMAYWSCLILAENAPLSTIP